MFDQLTGNSRVKAVLKRMLTTGRLPGALLFTGEEGIGKKLFALEVARALNCRTPHLGVRRLDAALSSITLDRDQSGVKPPHSKELPNHS